MGSQYFSPYQTIRLQFKSIIYHLPAKTIFKVFCASIPGDLGYVKRIQRGTVLLGASNQTQYQVVTALLILNSVPSSGI